MTFPYTYGIDALLTNEWTTADLRVIALAATSTCGAEEDVQTIDGFSTLGEVTGTGYERKALATLTKNVITASDLVRCSAGPLTYTALDADDIVALLIYLHVTLDSDSIPLLYYDNTFTVTATAPAASGATKVYVDPLPYLIPSGSQMTFSGSTLVTLTALAAAGARSLTVSALPGAIALAETATSPSSQFPIQSDGGNVSIVLPSDLLEFRRAA